MGKINLTPLRVRKRALANLKTNLMEVNPVWMEVVGEVPPAQIFTRKQPISQPLTQLRTQSLPDGTTKQHVTMPTSKKSRAKPSRLFAPAPIRYEEDQLRKQFFSDHPWELARPRIVLETTGNQHKNADWSTGLLQPGIPLSGESVVQRQLWLLENVPDMTVDSAYDVARREFYAHRRQEETRRRVSQEEAMHMGAQPEKGVLQWSMEIENRAYKDWEVWAKSQLFEQVQKSAAFTGDIAKPDEDMLRDNENKEQDTRINGVLGRQQGEQSKFNSNGRISKTIGTPGNSVFDREKRRQNTQQGIRSPA